MMAVPVGPSMSPLLPISGKFHLGVNCLCWVRIVQDDLDVSAVTGRESCCACPEEL